MPGWFLALVSGALWAETWAPSCSHGLDAMVWSNSLMPWVVLAQDDGTASREVGVRGLVLDSAIDGIASREVGIRAVLDSPITSGWTSREVGVRAVADATQGEGVLSREVGLRAVSGAALSDAVISREVGVSATLGILTGRLTFQGLVSQTLRPNPVLFSFTRVSDGSSFVRAVFLTSDGSFQLFVDSDLYSVSIKPTTFLRRRWTADLTQPSSPALLTLINGDSDRSGEVDLSDLDLIVSAYGTSEDDRNGIPGTDLDRSGEVDLADIDIAIGNYLESDE